MTTTNTAADRNFSDLHKDAFGFRPSADQWAAWNRMTVAQLDETEQAMIRIVAASVEEEQAAQQRAVTRFEAYITAMMADHNIDRETAIRWDRQAEGEESDRDAYEWSKGLPYRYLTLQR